MDCAQLTTDSNAVLLNFTLADKAGSATCEVSETSSVLVCTYTLQQSDVSGGAGDDTAGSSDGTGGSLSGTLTKSTAATGQRIATFNDVQVGIGTGLSLVATATGADSVTSATFDIDVFAAGNILLGKRFGGSAKVVWVLSNAYSTDVTSGANDDICWHNDWTPNSLLCHDGMAIGLYDYSDDNGIKFTGDGSFIVDAGKVLEMRAAVLFQGHVDSRATSVVMYGHAETGSTFPDENDSGWSVLNPSSFSLADTSAAVSFPFNETVKSRYLKVLVHNDGSIAATYAGIRAVQLFQVAAPMAPPWFEQTVGNPIVSRTGHSMTLLGNGKVLIAGGGTATAELYDPATGTFTATGSMSQSRAFHIAVKQPDGKVLIAGGGNDSVELYDPDAGTFATLSATTISTKVKGAVLLPNDNVLMLAGSDSNGDPDLIRYTNSSNLFDVVSQTFSSVMHLFHMPTLPIRQKFTISTATPSLRVPICSRIAMLILRHCLRVGKC